MENNNHEVEGYINSEEVHSLKGLTPYEALTGVQLPKEEWKQQIEEAKRVRTIENRNKPCEICES